MTGPDAAAPAPGSRGKGGRGPERTLLFVLHDFSYLRNFTASIMALRREGFRIVLAMPETGEALERRSIVRRGIVELRRCPRGRDDRWARLADALRQARAYAHYRHPRFARADFLRQRTLERIPDEVQAHLDPWLRRRPRTVARLLAAAELAVPAWRPAVELLREIAPDAVLVSPCMFPNTYYQTDYIKAAHALGLPVAVPVFSWDNLTNKWPIAVPPDLLLVWNETQRHEAVEIHGLPSAAVTVTGGMRFADFFGATPRTARRDYLEALGLDPARPLILYLGSSHTIAPQEQRFAARWLAALRAHPNPRLSGCNVLIRPHPSNSGIWQHLDLAPFGRAALAPTAGSNVEEVVDATLHSAAVVGINTTAMLEAGALDRPVFAVVDPEIRDGQQGTLHFHYLTEVAGGLITTAAGLEEHCRQLAAALEGDGRFVEKSRRFAAAFLRPPPPARDPVAVFVAAVAGFTRGRRKSVRAPLWAPLLRLALWPLARRLAGKARMRPRRRGEPEHERKAKAKLRPRG